MRRYLDASALVSLFSIDEHSDRAIALIRPEDAVLVVSDFARTEFASVVARLVRMRDLTKPDATTMFANFDVWVADNAAQVALGTQDVMTAEATLRRLDLNRRAPDALHIAIARRLDAILVTFDRRLEQAARSLGVATEGIVP